MSRVYVASSWRNPIQPAVIAALRAEGIDCYDFRNPPNKSGFGWAQVMPTFDIENQLTDQADYLRGIDHPIARAGFAADYFAMAECDACVLVLPCGRSAHLELGWCAGQKKPTAILLDGPLVIPELMYKLTDYLAPTLPALVQWAKGALL